MPNFSSKQSEKMFNKLRVNRSSCNHHIRGFIVDNSGKKLFPPIFMSKGSKELPRKVEDNLRKSLKVDKQDFKELIECRMSRDEYLKVRNDKNN